MFFLPSFLYILDAQITTQSIPIYDLHYHGGKDQISSGIFFFLPEGKRIVFIFFRKIVGRYIVEQTQISLLTAGSWEASIFWHWVAGWLTAD